MTALVAFALAVILIYSLPDLLRHGLGAPLAVTLGLRGCGDEGVEG